MWHSLCLRPHGTNHERAATAKVTTSHAAIGLTCVEMVTVRDDAVEVYVAVVHA